MPERYPDKAFFIMSLVTGPVADGRRRDVDPDEPVMHWDGVPFLQGAENSLRAVRSLNRYADFQRAWTETGRPARTDSQQAERGLIGLDGNKVQNSVEGPERGRKTRPNQKNLKGRAEWREARHPARVIRCPRPVEPVKLSRTQHPCFSPGLNRIPAAIAPPGKPCQGNARDYQRSHTNDSSGLP